MTCLICRKAEPFIFIKLGDDLLGFCIECQDIPGTFTRIGTKELLSPKQVFEELKRDRLLREIKKL